MWGLAKLDPEDREIVRRARRGEELFWGGAVCWWGDMRRRLTPDPRPFRQEVNCPVEGLLPPSHRSLDSHQVVRHYLTGLEGELVKPEVLQKITYLELKLRLPEHLLMRVDKLTMAHAVEARVPYLDHEVVEFARRLPPSYKLRQGIGKYLIKEAAAPYLDQEIIHRPKQGFGAPVEQWMQEGDFGPRCLAAYQRSGLRRMGLFDDEYLLGLFRRQISHGGGLSFHLWTILNAVLWHEYWIEGRKDCF
jgi:asparagine synthase (glutamine-hydrolysing)